MSSTRSNSAPPKVVIIEKATTNMHPEAAEEVLGKHGHIDNFMLMSAPARISDYLTLVRTTVTTHTSPIATKITEACDSIRGNVQTGLMFVQAEISNKTKPIRAKGTELFDFGKRKIEAITEPVLTYVAPGRRKLVETYQHARNKAFNATEGKLTTVFKYIAFIRGKASIAMDSMQTTTKTYITPIKSNALNAFDSAHSQACSVVDYTKTKAAEASSRMRDVALDPKVQVATMSAAGSAVALGTSGGATGLVAGGIMGTAVGVVPALFTFGLSIPLGAVLGSGAGLCVGTVVGGTAGLVSGGVAGCSVYSKRTDIRNSADDAMAKLGSCKEYVKAKLSGTGGTN